jgi:RND family efflux transporter MFP subunit
LPAAPAASAPRAPKPTLGCLISPERVADVGSPVVGVVADIPVDNGDLVQAGQALVQLRSDVEQAGLQAAQARSAIEADVHAARANVVLAHQRHARAVELVREGFVSPQAVEQARAERDVADQKLQQARGQQAVSQQELRVVQAQLGQRTVRSPFRGVVVERFVNTGERVEDKPLLRLAMLDPLRVEIVMPASRWGSVGVSSTLSVVPELPGAGSMAARVTHVDKVIDAASNTFRVRLSLPNPGHKLPAGARCKVDEPGLSATSLPARGSL